MAINVSQIFPPSPYSPQDEALIQSSQIEATFDPSLNYIEYVISTPNNSFQSVDVNYNNYSFPTNGTVTSNLVSSIEINPTNDITQKGFNSGEYKVYYNFYKNELLTSPTDKGLFIKKISSDRTELVMRYVSPNIDPVLAINDFVTNNTSFYFNDFYLNFGNNVLLVANNIQANPTTGDILVNLYNPLPSNLSVNSNFWVVTKIADSLAFNISFTSEPVLPPAVTFNIKGPNFNINTQDKVNNTTNYINYTSLLSNQLTSSVNQIKSYLNEKSINISIDYTDFSNFVHFSSAEQRINNFYYKIQQIENYSSSIAELISVTSSLGSINIFEDKITNIIKNFDGYEYYMYYESGSYTWPKSNSTVPYILYPSNDTIVTTWLEDRLTSASIYDENNQDYLYYSIPEYVVSDVRNESYTTFIQLIGQHYDSIWTYYKDVTNRYNADNRLDYGISKDLVAEALKSFGIKVYQNNFTSGDLFNAFTGFNSGSTGINLHPTGSELITNYITASYEASVTPIDDYNKEIYKRLYHNLPYLAKTKGTIPGLRALINCFGVPDTILRISEFGGRDKDTSTYDYFDQQFNYAYQAYNVDTSEPNHITTNFQLTSSWDPTTSSSARPNSIQLRLKPLVPTDFSIESNQYIFEISGSSIGFIDLTLTYTGSGLNTPSYSGSSIDPYYQYGTLTLDVKGNGTSTSSLYLPFFNGDWWSVMINRSGSIGGNNTFTLYAGNKLYYDGYDGNQIGYLQSSSYTQAGPGGWIGDAVEFFGSNGISGSAYRNYRSYQGDIQELRYWNATQSLNSFKDYVMNPMSIDFEGENTYADHLAFRAPLGTTLITGSGYFTSIHPKITGSWTITQSFSDGTSTYLTGRNEYNTNVESRFLNSPIVGLKGRVTDKIQIISSSLPTGNVLSQYTSIEQYYPASGSESPDVNLLEIAFSPQNEVNDDIIESLGYFNIGEYIGDPRQVSSSATSYPDLNKLSNDFFQKYFDTYDLQDYVRLIKYFDNSLFKMIKDFVPARTSLTSGVVIKQHLLERNKYPQPKVDNTQFQNINVYSSSAGLYEVFNYEEDLTYEGIIDTAFISGSTGGTFNDFNNLNFTQSWIETYDGPTGVSYISHSSQDEFYNGELPGTEYVVTNGELNPNNDFKYPSTLEIYYNPTLYTSDITLLSDFLDINTSPNQGEIYLWYDTGSILQPSVPGIPQR
jgi:hypothetical protein